MAEYVEPVPEWRQMTIRSADGTTVTEWREVIVYPADDPNAEVRDPDTGEVIFPAIKGPLRLIEGGAS